MRLFVVNGSPNCRKALAVIRHLQMDVDVRPQDFMAGDMNTPSFLAMNPNGMVPVLEDGSLHLWESNAIMQYLASKAGQQTLWPDDPRARADIARWQFWEVAHYNRALATVVSERVLKPMFGMGEPNTVLVDNALKSFARFVKVLDGHLDGRRYLVGDDLTLADFAVGSMTRLLEPSGISLDDAPNVAAWYARLDEQPAWSGIPDLGEAA